MATIDYLTSNTRAGIPLHELTGYIPSTVDHRDAVAAPDGASSAPEVYSNPWLDIPALDQGHVPKCVASSLSTCKSMMSEDESALALVLDDDEFYSHIAAPGGGADIRTALDWAVHTGILLKATGTPVLIKSYAGVVVTDHEAVRQMISGAGLVEIGFDVPESFMRGGGAEFKVDPNNATPDRIVGGHGICVPAYSAVGPILKNTWGDDWPTPGAHGLVQVSWDFWDTYVQECWVPQD